MLPSVATRGRRDQMSQLALGAAAQPGAQTGFSAGLDGRGLLGGSPSPRHPLFQLCGPSMPLQAQDQESARAQTESRGSQ